jgi:hypothetical protein
MKFILVTILAIFTQSTTGFAQPSGQLPNLDKMKEDMDKPQGAITKPDPKAIKQIQKQDWGAKTSQIKAEGKAKIEEELKKKQKLKDQQKR